jgi:hypothetical protein
MLFKPTINLLLATLAAALPSKRQSQPNLSVTLTNTTLDVTEVFHASTDGTAVIVDTTVAIDFVRIECLEICIPEFHCILHDKNLSRITTLGPGNTGFAPGVEVGMIICGPWLPDFHNESQPPVAEATATEP